MSNLVKSTNFPSMKSMMEDFWNTDRFFEKPFFSQAAMPPVNIRDTENKYELQLAVPGYSKDDFKIAIENSMITISAENKSEEKEEKENYTRHEFRCEEFTRMFSLPDNVKEDDIKAKYVDGLLTIELKKSSKAPANKKTVQVS
ncbi:MAG TPA: Hsp20/alpha crystallin family protein [Pseudosphingobacterium sp.]|nr:Hsp20/alpha crystallin family protein [Pseudosphingobacterium sp.]